MPEINVEFYIILIEMWWFSKMNRYEFYILEAIGQEELKLNDFGGFFRNFISVTVIIGFKITKKNVKIL